MHNRIYSLLLLFLFSAGISTSQAMFIDPKDFSLMRGVIRTISSPAEWLFFIANSESNLNNACGSAGFAGSIIRNCIPAKDYAKLDSLTQTVLEHPYASSYLLGLVMDNGLLPLIFCNRSKDTVFEFLLCSLYLGVHYKLKSMHE